jgi:hypothetical protein
MSKINVTYYKTLDEIKITTDFSSNFACDIHINITKRETYGAEKTSFDVENPIDISTFSIKIKEANNKFSEINYPPDGCSLKTTDQFLLHSQRINWKTGDEFNITATVGTKTATLTYTVPKPTKPYPSWIWSDTNNYWVAPVAYPSGGAMHDWNEDKQDWVEVEE